jgi:disulfide bond formation protein DsbB
VTRDVRRAASIAFLLPCALLGGAWGAQLIGGLYPCEMCHWQRWPHYAALVPGVLALVVPGRARVFAALAAVLIAVSGAIGVFHAGVEYGWWPGVTGCTSTLDLSGGDAMAAVLRAPLIRCDVAQWTLGGVSLAGFNAILSLGGALAILVLLTRRTR